MASAGPKTDILLPYKEIMSEANAGAIARIVRDLSVFSGHSAQLCIYGRPLDTPWLTGAGYQPLKARLGWLYGENDGFVRAYLAHLRQRPDSERPDLVEVHGRCQVAKQIKQQHPNIKVSLYLHNDPSQMKGAKTPAERQWLLENLDAVIFVSSYLRDCFSTGLQAAHSHAEKLIVIPNEVTRTYGMPPKKKNHIILAGRMVPEKGILPACEAAARILPSYPSWTIDIAGGRHFRTEAPSDYEKKIIRALAPLGQQARYHGFLPGTEVAALQAQAAIAIVPSLWHEPAGLTVMESLMHGCALITTDRGGIPETAGGRADIIALPDWQSDKALCHAVCADKLAGRLDHFLHDEQARNKLQATAWQNYPFSAENMAANADNYRTNLWL